MYPGHGVSAWPREHPFLVDTMLALLVAAASVPSLYWYADLPEWGEFREPGGLAVGLTLTSSLVLAWRRRYPLTVLLAAVVPTLVLASMNYGATGLAPLLALYAVAVYGDRERATVGFFVALFSTLLSLRFDASEDDAGTVVAVLGVLLAVWAFGRNTGSRRAYTAELEARAHRLERSREVDMRAALAEERGRIARELHDVVAHHVSVMTVQASGARRMVSRQPERAMEAMAAVEETGRDALVEMRRIVDVLRGPWEAQGQGAMAPQPGVGEIDDLVAQVREAGLEVRLDVEGEPHPLSPGVDLTAYRIVQEALTNTLKHAGRTRSRVLLRYDPRELLVRVIDDGRNGQVKGSPVAADGVGDDRQGHGLLGMRERVTLYGGRLYTGPRAGGGYEVLARIPLEHTSP